MQPIDKRAEKLNPRARYTRDLKAGKISADSGQEFVLDRLSELFERLANRPPSRSLFAGLLNAITGRGSIPVLKGIYLWGGVGRGKTYLMDLFYESLPTEAKKRTHFHRFMQSVHKSLARYQGRKDPLRLVAEDIASETRVLCFDEFFVLDIGDAMILSGLLSGLFEQGVTLVATSNVHPDHLYENGLQRERFLPAIELLKTYNEVLELGAGTDYRLRTLSQSTLYHYPIGPETDSVLRETLLSLAPDAFELSENESLSILGREISCRCCASDVAWFDFAALCEGPRSAADYVEIARLFHALILSAVPALNDTVLEATRRFVFLVDELYDRRVKLIVAARVPLDSLYTGEALTQEFKRTYSRLWEMQSNYYLGVEHRA